MFASLKIYIFYLFLFLDEAGSHVMYLSDVAGYGICCCWMRQGDM